jgi:uncharacterized protein YajQ (UPF0234 family)
MPSFDTVIEPDLVELRNAVEQTTKEIGTRFDFKGSAAPPWNWPTAVPRTAN